MVRSEIQEATRSCTGAPGPPGPRPWRAPRAAPPPGAGVSDSADRAGWIPATFGGGELVMCVANPQICVSLWDFSTGWSTAAAMSSIVLP
ncbi:hypothetical protein GCM10022245_31940 [Streptomyces mayteni]